MIAESKALNKPGCASSSAKCVGWFQLSSQFCRLDRNEVRNSGSCEAPNCSSLSFKLRIDPRRETPE
jgi:hypothetical protein